MQGPRQLESRIPSPSVACRAVAMGDCVEPGTPPMATEMEPLTEDKGSLEQGPEMTEQFGHVGMSSDQQHVGVENSLEQCTLPKPSYSTRDSDIQNGEENQTSSQETDPQGGGTLITLTADKAGQYHCSECDVWAQGHAFEEHIMCHLMLKPYQCLYCSQCFKSRRQVSSHVAEEHTGQKMNCALKALKRVKAIMKATLESGKHEFYACEPGKVPLLKPPSKNADRAKASKPSGKSSSTAVVKKDSQSVAKSDGASTLLDPALSSSETESEKLANEIRNNDDICQDENETSQSNDDSSQGDGGDQSQDHDSNHDGSEEELQTGETCSDSHSVNKLKSMDTDRNAANETSSDCEAKKNVVNGWHENDQRIGNSEEETEKGELTSKFPEDTQSDDTVNKMESTVAQTSPDLPSSDSSAAQGNTSTLNISETPDLTGNSQEKPDTVREPEVEAGSAASRSTADGTEMEALSLSSADTSAGNLITSCAQSDEHVIEENPQEMTCDEIGELAVDADLCGETSDSETKVSDENGRSGFESNQIKDEEGMLSLEYDGSSCDQKEKDFLQSNFKQSEEDSNGTGLKIVAAFSLQEDDAQKQTVIESEEVNRTVEKELPSVTDHQEPGHQTAETSNTDSTSVEESTMSPASRDLVRTLGPPSKPVPSSSFLELPYYSSPIMSQGHGAQPAQSSFHFFICGFSCSFSCLTSAEFRDHLMLDHAGEVSFSCFHCGYQSASEDGLIRHISAHSHTYSKSVPLYICGASACKFGSNLVADFITHQSTWHPDLTVFHCHDCDERFESVDDLLKHFEANFLHIINCPHCSAKSTERRTLLNHIASVHPGKPKMVSVAKQIVCRDRKMNDYFAFMQQRCEMVPYDDEQYSFEMMDTASGNQKSDSDQTDTNSVRNKCLLSILTEPIQTRGKKQPTTLMKTKTEFTDEANDGCGETFEDSFDEEENNPETDRGAYSGSQDEKREVNDFKCHYCTFVARDQSRLEGHERGHSLPSSRKTRFKCMYCPQSFNNDVKFHSHITCHPGLIRFNLYRCKHCSFDSNQRHIIVKHARSTHDTSCESIEDDLYTVIDKTMETRVLACYQCSYMSRHRKHLVDHVKRQHSGPGKMGESSFVYKRRSAGERRGSAVPLNLDQEPLDGLSAGHDGIVKENQTRRFKCPICQYLLPRAADLQAHVKRHSEIGEITLVMFRCKYCSAASTAREVIHRHLQEKHVGKQMSLVKKIVKIDTRAEDNGYAVTSVDDEKNSGAEKPPGLSKTGQMALVIPDSAGETLQYMHCPVCAFSTSSRQSIIAHVTRLHPDVKVMGRRQDNELYALNVSAGPVPRDGVSMGETSKGEILIVPDSPMFEEEALCPKCDYSTLCRRSMVQHLDENHPEVSVMGRNDYPSFEGKDTMAMEAGAGGRDDMVIIGSGSLDEKIRCLYQGSGDGVKCMICHAYRPKKYFIHVHILRHLNILLWGCQYCSHKGLQKFKMMDHIKKVHPKRAYCVRYLPVNVEEEVNQYLQNASKIQARRDDGNSALAGKSPQVFPMDVVDSEDLGLKKKTVHDSLEGCIIGSDELDMKLACLYSMSSAGQYHCVVCAQEFQRRFAMHRHLVQIHLKVNLIGCGYCDVEGVERHIIMDHILETHRSRSLSMRNLAHSLQDKVTEFLGHMTVSADADDDLESPQSGLNDDLGFKLPDVPQLTPDLDSVEATSRDWKTSFRSPSPASSAKSSKNQLNPNLLLLGKDSLNKHLQCMYKPMSGPVTKFRCLVCRGVFDRKYAIHRHLLMKHLRVGIIGCPYCSFEGVERYQVFTHIKEDHKGAELRVCHLTMDLSAIVSEYMQNVNNGTVDLNSKTPPPWSMRKTVKKEAVGEDEQDPQPSTSSETGHGLVVAMFGARRSGLKIKEEPLDEDEVETLSQEPRDLEVSGGEADSVDNMVEEDAGGMDEGEDGEMNSSSHQGSSGSRVKSPRDVLTNIRVITVNRSGIRSHSCEKCNFTSLHRSNVVRHIYRVHEQYREQECPICKYRTLRRVLMEHHMQHAHPGLPGAGSEPDRGTKRKAETTPENTKPAFVKKERLSTSPETMDPASPLEDPPAQSFACADCSFEARSQDEIVQHIHSNHSSGKEEEEWKRTSAEEEAKDTEFESLAHSVKMSQVNLSGGSEDWLWQCFYCSYKTSDEEDLKIHFADSHPMNSYRSKKVPTFRFVCGSCQVKTRAHSKMRYHLNRHINYRPYTCTTCGSFFPSPDQCRKHCRANNHSETFTYIKVPRKEKHLQELLQKSQKLALALTTTPTDVDMLQSSFSFPPPAKRKAPTGFSLSNIPLKQGKVKDDKPQSPEGTEEQEGKGREEGEEIVCGCCDFSAHTVFAVRTHFHNAHPDKEFLWKDSSTGYICTESGDITNAKDMPGCLEMPPDSGYCVTGSGSLSCRQCHFTTSTVQAMKSHIKRHLPKRFLCPYCSMRCSRRDTVSLHVRCAHRGRVVWLIFFQVPESSDVSLDNPDQSLGLAESQVTVGEEARQEASPPPASRPKASSQRIGCGQCDVKLDSVAEVYRHHGEQHPDLPFHWVDSANGYTFNFLGEVMDAKAHTPDLFSKDGFTVVSGSGKVPSFCCKLCPFTSAFIQAIKSHMKSHLPHGFMCPYCCMTTSSKEKMVSHQSCGHRGQESWILHLRMSSELASGSGVEKSKDGQPQL